MQKQIDSLPNPTDPATIAELLHLRKDVMFLEFDTAVRHCMTDTFLSTGNVQAFKVKLNVAQHSSTGCTFRLVQCTFLYVRGGTIVGIVLL